MRGPFFDLEPTSRSLMLSQAGPCGAWALTVRSCHFRALGPWSCRKKVRGKRGTSRRCPLIIFGAGGALQWSLNVANGLPRWHGAQLALDATFVSPVTETRSRGDTQPQPGGAIDNAAQRNPGQSVPTRVFELPAQAAAFGVG